MILELLWKQGELSVREVCDALQHRSHRISFNATMTILNRLVEKRVLLKKRSIQEGVFVYTPKMDRSSFFARVRRDVLRNVVADRDLFSAAAFAEAVDDLSPKDREALRKILERREL